MVSGAWPQTRIAALNPRTSLEQIWKRQGQTQSGPEPLLPCTDSLQGLQQNGEGRALRELGTLPFPSELREAMGKMLWVCVFTRSWPLGAHSACPGLYAQDCPLCSECRSLAGVSPEGLTWEHVGFPSDHWTPAEAASSPRTPMMQAPTPAPPAGL